MDGESAQQIESALALIGATPGYADVAEDLARMQARGKIRRVSTLEDRAHTGLTGTITLGAEALDSGVVGLAETLVHEHFHARRQSPLLKTASFWGGVVTQTPVMQRYERPAYQAAWDFLTALERALPEFAADARSEREAIETTFAAEYGATLGDGAST